MPAVVSKKGIDDGNQKVGTLPSRQKKDLITIAHFDIKFFLYYNFYNEELGRNRRRVGKIAI